MDKIFGLLAAVLITALIFVSNALLPGRWVTGYNRARFKKKN